MQRWDKELILYTRDVNKLSSLYMAEKGSPESKRNGNL